MRALWKVNESAGSPSTLADSDASPVNLTAAYNGTGAAIVNTSWGNALRIPDVALNTTNASAALSGADKIGAAFGGSATKCSVVSAFQINAATGDQTYGSLCGYNAAGGSDGCLLQAGNKTGAAGHMDLALTATFSSSGVDGDWAIIDWPSAGYYVAHGLADTTLATANDRMRLCLNGFLVANCSTGTASGVAPALNATLITAQNLDIGGLSAGRTFNLRSVDVASALITDVALTLADVLRQSLRLFAANGSDSDPDSAGTKLLSAVGPAGQSGGLGATAAASSNNTSSKTATPSITIAASGANRGVFLAITGQGVSAGVSGTPTLNGTNGTKITNTLSSTNDVEWWWWNEASLPSSAGTYNLSATVDGTNGTLACSTYYLEGINQSTPTNFGSATGTSTSLTASMTSNPAAGSILLGCLLDITTTDAPTHGVNQLPLAKVNGTSTGNTHVHVGSAKYVTSSGANSMSWTNLTNSSAKVGVAIEVKLVSSGSTVDVTAGYKQFLSID